MANPLKRIVKPLVDPAVYDFWVRKLVPHASWDTPLARVTARHVEARDAVTLELQPNGHFQGFRPGQHINVTVEVEGVRHTRSYSLSDVPRQDGRIAISVRQIEGGRVSEELCRHTRIGDVVEIGQAFGEMTIPEDYRGNWLLAAAGSGITPLMSIIRSLVRKPLAADVTLLYWARTRTDLFFYRELCEIAAREPRFRFVPILTREPELLSGEERGRPDEALVARLGIEPADCRVYACGPGGFVESVRDLFAHKAGAFLAEAFSPAPRVESEAMAQVQVELRASGRTLSLASGTPLLKAMEDAGIFPAYGCRMGICNTCACGKVSGATRDINTGETSDDASAALRLCVNAACSDLVLDL